MDLRHFRYFVCIVEQRSFSRAAATLHIAQPALSLHVRNMEAELGTPLLFRTPQGVVPTEAGEILYARAQAIIEQFSQMQDEIRGKQTNPSGEVRIGMPGTISQLVSVPLIAAARREYPDVKLRIAEAMSGFVLEWLREHRVDLAFLYRPTNDTRLHSRPVLSEELCLVGPARPQAGMPRPDGPRLSFDEVSRLPLVLPGDNHGLRELLNAEAERRNIRLETAVDVDSYQHIRDLVAQGYGYSILPRSAVSMGPEDERLACWTITEPELTRSVYVVGHANRPETTALARIKALCLEIFADMVRDGRWKGASLVSRENEQAGASASALVHNNNGRGKTS